MSPSASRSIVSGGESSTGGGLSCGENATGRRAVLVEDDTVVKIQEPSASRRERLRTQAGREVGLQTGLFLVPEVVSYDDARGKIVFERLRLTGIRQALSDRTRGMELAGRAAGVLAAIHRQMELSEEFGPSAPDGVKIGLERESVPLHGDFGMRNIFCTPGSDRIVVIDWANADWIGIDADRGAPEIDIAVFLISLFHRRVFGPWAISQRHEMARHFLATYASASPHGLDLETLRAIVAMTRPSFNRRTRRRKGRLRALAYRHSMLDLEFFIRRLSQRDLAGRSDRQRG